MTEAQEHQNMLDQSLEMAAGRPPRLLQAPWMKSKPAAVMPRRIPKVSASPSLPLLQRRKVRKLVGNNRHSSGNNSTNPALIKYKSTATGDHSNSTDSGVDGDDYSDSGDEILHQVEQRNG